MFMIANICGRIRNRPNMGLQISSVLWRIGLETLCQWAMAISHKVDLFCDLKYFDFSRSMSWAGWSPLHSCSRRAGSWCKPPCPQAQDMWKPSHPLSRMIKSLILTTLKQRMSWDVDTCQLFYWTRVNLGQIFGSGCPSVTDRRLWDFTDVTLADEDTNSIPTDNANRAIQGSVAMQVAPPSGQTCYDCK